MRLPEAFRSLRYRDFRVFFVAQTISQIATWMHSVAQTWLILSLTNSPLLLGLITMLHWGPILLLALPGGAIADRVAKRPCSSRPRRRRHAQRSRSPRWWRLAWLRTGTSASWRYARAWPTRSSITSAGCQTSLQLRSSNELRGRVMSLFTLIHGGCSRSPPR